MVITEKNKSNWHGLYKLAEAFRDSKPWEYLDDSFIFGIQDPQTDDIGWCVVMGAAGQVYGLMVYSGDEGLRAYEDIVLSFGEDEDMNIALSQKGFKVEFVNRDEVDKKDLETYKQLNLKFRGRNEYISIRRIDPDLYPWYIEESQIGLLTICLQQSIQIIAKYDSGEIEMTDFECGELLLMVPERKSGKVKWKATYIDFPEFDDVIKYIPNTFILNRLKKELKIKDSVLFFSFQYMKEPLQDMEGQRPYFPKFAFWVDGNTGMIIDYLILKSDDWKEFQSKLTHVFHTLKFLPATIVVDSNMGIEIMELYCDNLGIDMVYAGDHPIFQQVKESMLDFF